MVASLSITAVVDSVASSGGAQGWFTLIAAVIAALAAVVGAVVAGVSAAKSRNWVGRDQWWQRFSWAIEKSISKDPSESELGLSVLIALIDVPWAKPEDNEMAVAVADVITPNNNRAGE
jgi:hypothetical protein